MAKTVSENGKRFAARFEAFRASPYFATADEKARGIYTWGYGHTGKVPPRTSISESDALVLLGQDFESAVAVVNGLAPGSLTQAQFDAMCDLVFNVGPAAFRNPGTGQLTGTGAALKAGDIATLRVKLPQFTKQGGVVLKGLVRRANGRLALFDGLSADDAYAKGMASA